MAGPANGWGKLGEMLGGGDAGGQEAAYIDQMNKVQGMQRTGYQRDKAMEDASFARNINIARAAGLGPALEKMGVSAESAGVANQIAQMNKSFTASSLGDFAVPGYDEAVDSSRQAMAAGDIGAYNQFNAQAQGKSYQPVRVAGGAYIEDGVRLGDLDMVPTLPTMTAQQASETRLDQGQQRTNAAVAKSNRIPAPRTGGGGKPNTDNEVLAQARERVADGADPQTVADYLARKGYPGLADKLYKRSKSAAAAPKAY